MSLSTLGWTGVVIENEASLTCENVNRRFEMYFQEAISAQR